MESEKNIPITIVTGFLGAGKTSLINHFLEEDHCHHQAVLVNDFGEVKLNTPLIAPEGMVKLVHGCFCCSSRGAMQAALKQMTTAKPTLEKILIEASGVADPCAIVTGLENPELKTRVAVQSVICIVAADQILVLKGEMAQLAKTQITCANLVIVNKIDLVSKGQLSSVLGWLQTVKTGIPILPASHGVVPTESLQDLRGPEHIVTEQKTITTSMGSGRDHTKV